MGHAYTGLSLVKRSLMTRRHRTVGLSAFLIGAAILSRTALAQTTPDPVLSPDAVPNAPALGPDQTPTSPALLPDQTNPAPVLQPGAVAPDPALDPGTVPNNPALSPDQTNPPPVPPPEPSDSLAPLPPIFPNSNQ